MRLTLLFQVFEFGRRKGWCERNPVKQVDRPEVEQHQDIRFLTIEEVEALLGRSRMTRSLAQRIAPCT